MKIYKFNNLKNKISDYIFINNIYKLEIVLLEKKLRKIEILLSLNINKLNIKGFI